MTAPGFPCRASRPSYRLIEAAENKAVAEINRRMKKLLAEFERKAEARIAEALRR
jgi:hypothetical protein